MFKRLSYDFFDDLNCECNDGNATPYVHVFEKDRYCIKNIK